MRSYLLFVLSGLHLMLVSYVCEISNVLEQLAGAMPQTLAVTPEEREAIERVSLFFIHVSFEDIMITYFGFNSLYRCYSKSDGYMLTISVC